MNPDPEERAPRVSFGGGGDSFGGDDSGHDKYLRLILEKNTKMSIRLIMEKQIISILKYIRDNQHKNSITEGQVVRYMDDNAICSRLTTLKLIQRLLDPAK